MFREWFDISDVTSDVTKTQKLLVDVVQMSRWPPGRRDVVYEDGRQNCRHYLVLKNILI